MYVLIAATCAFVCALVNAMFAVISFRRSSQVSNTSNKVSNMSKCDVLLAKSAIQGERTDGIVNTIATVMFFLAGFLLVNMQTDPTIAYASSGLGFLIVIFSSLYKALHPVQCTE